MKVLAFAVLSFFAIRSVASPEYTVEAFPGKVKVLVDLNALIVKQAVDILFVVDSSGSMMAHQENLARHIPGLVEQIKKSDLDFHVGVVTTDMLGNGGDSPDAMGKLVGSPKFVTPDTPNLETELQENLLVGTNGAGTEMMFAPVIAALTEPLVSKENAGFYREDADLAIIFVTDAEDQGTLQVDSFLDSLRNLKGGFNNKISIQGIIVPTGTDESFCQRDEATTPKKLEQAINEMGGKAYSLCDVKFGENLRSIGRDIVKVKKPNYGEIDRLSIPLPSLPVLNSIEVKHGQNSFVMGDVAYGWVYDSALNQVIMGQKIVWTGQPLNVPLELTYVPMDWSK
jgi:hypothetical protein